WGGVGGAGGAVRGAQAARWRAAAPSHREIRDGRSRSLGARSPSAAGDVGIAGASGLRAPGAHLVAPLRGRVLAAHRTRGRLAAALAGSAARLPPAREPRGYPRRTFRPRLLPRPTCPARP